MATLVNSDANVLGELTPTVNTLTASDVLTFDPKKLQLLELNNPTAGSLTVLIDGAGGTTVPVDGVGSVSVAAGLSIVLAAGATKAVRLSSIRQYLQGVVTLTGAAGVLATIYNL